MCFVMFSSIKNDRLSLVLYFDTRTPSNLDRVIRMRPFSINNADFLLVSFATSWSHSMVFHFATSPGPRGVVLFDNPCRPKMSSTSHTRLHMCCAHMILLSFDTIYFTVPFSIIS